MWHKTSSWYVVVNSHRLLNNVIVFLLIKRRGWTIHYISYANPWEVLNSRGSFFVTARATALLNLGHALSDVGDVDDAVRSLREALDINKEIHGSNHRIVAANYNYLSYGYLQMGMVPQAKKELLNALKVMHHYSRFHPGNKRHCYFQLQKRLETYSWIVEMDWVKGPFHILGWRVRRHFFFYNDLCHSNGFFVLTIIKKIDWREFSLQPELYSTQIRC